MYHNVIISLSSPASSLRLNTTKTQVGHVAGFQSASQTDWHCWHAGYVDAGQRRRRCPWPRVIIDSQLTISAHVATLCRVGFLQLGQLRSDVHSLTPDAARTLVQELQTFVSCRLDYCSPLLYDASDSIIRKSSQSWMPPHVLSPELDDATMLHLCYVSCKWLPVRWRVEYKVACLVHQSLSGQAPVYLTNDISLITDSGRHLLQSASARTCDIPRTHNSFCDRSFGAAGPLCMEQSAILLASGHQLRTV